MDQPTPGQSTSTRHPDVIQLKHIPAILICDRQTEAIVASIELKHIDKSFDGTSILRHVSVAIEDGQFVALLGPSGCGKSTLLRIIAGLEKQDAGEVHIAGRRVDHLGAAKRDVAMVFQSYALYPHMTVERNIASPLRLAKLNAFQRLPLFGPLLPACWRKLQDIRREVQEVAAALKIEHLLDRKPDHLSGGQRQRVAIGRAVIRRPQIFLMDEPLSNLDANLRAQMRGELVDLHRRLSATIIYITHDQAEAMTMADKIAVMHAGEIVQFAPPAEIYSNPSCRLVAEFVGSPRINLLRGTLCSNGFVQTGKLRIPVTGRARPQEVAIGIRPEAMIVKSASEGGWLGIIRRIEHHGGELIFHVTPDQGNGDIIIRRDLHDAFQLQEGSRVSVNLRAGSPLFFDENGARLALHMQPEALRLAANSSA